MSVDWQELRGELPDDVRARLDDKRVERRLGRASGGDGELVLKSPDGKTQGVHFDPLVDVKTPGD
ncbi:hypothetical protein [Neorhizobium sp. AL 9.2.2]|uniref:hypothetical protein n=1 Tax=Neorhizobium sp. AL 9.2.2 TaxID=2712894 RepID=UPI00157413A1|nr:hypothetical protein [Neorhizobium sp. AL 9.2.2]NSY16541.1 hypothetical protein [Neorhizobium sp. AL 9.2.2]